MGRPVGVKDKQPRNTAARKWATENASRGLTAMQVFQEALAEVMAEWRDDSASLEARKAARSQAVAIADRMAPYQMPKLATTTVNANIRRNIAEFSADELAALAGADDGEAGDIPPGDGED